MSIIVKKYKSAIILFCLSLFIFYSFIPQRPVYALDGRTYVTIAEAAAITAETAVATGASVAIAPVVVTTLVVGAALYGGYKLLDRYGPNIVSKIKDTVSSWDKKTTNDYLYEYSKDGQSYVGLTEQGLDWSKKQVSNVSEFVGIDRTVNTDNTTDFSKPFIYNLYGTTPVYIVPYKVVSTPGHIYEMTKLKNPNGETSYIVGIDTSSNDDIALETYRNDAILQLKQFDKDKAQVVYLSPVGTNFHVAYIPTVEGGTFGFGYSTPYGTLDIEPSDLFETVDPVKMQVGQSISLPVTGTEIEGMTSYSTSVTPYSVTRETYSTQSVLETLPSTTPNIDDTDSDGSIVGKIGEWFGKLVLKIPILGTILQTLLDTLSFLKDFIGKLISSLRDLLTSLFIPSADVFKNKFKSIQEGLNDAFPVNFDILNNLKNANSSEPNLVYPFTIMGVNVKIDLNFIKIIVNVSRTIGGGLVAIFLAWYHYRHIVHLIRGTSPIVGDSHIGQSNAPISETSSNISHGGFSSGNFSSKGGK